jgi:hypothetical protein
MPNTRFLVGGSFMAASYFMRKTMRRDCLNKNRLPYASRTKIPLLIICCVLSLSGCATPSDADTCGDLLQTALAAPVGGCKPAWTAEREKQERIAQQAVQRKIADKAAAENLAAYRAARANLKSSNKDMPLGRYSRALYEIEQKFNRVRGPYDVAFWRKVIVASDRVDRREITYAEFQAAVAELDVEREDRWAAQGRADRAEMAQDRPITVFVYPY